MYASSLHPHLAKTADHSPLSRSPHRPLRHPAVMLQTIAANKIRVLIACGAGLVLLLFVAFSGLAGTERAHLSLPSLPASLHYDAPIAPPDDGSLENILNATLGVSCCMPGLWK